MAARYPRGKYRLLGRQTQPRMTAHNIVCAHTMVGSLAGTDAMFSSGGFTGTESTYGVGGVWGPDRAAGLDGVAYQWQDRAFTADANYKGSPEVISIETADNAPKRASDIAEWTPRQVARIVDIIAWECSLAAHADCPSSWACRRGVMWSGVRVAIPPVLIPDTKPGRRGLAVHRQGVEHSQGVGAVPGYLVAGGVRWSVSEGKECPGNARVRQFTRVVIPAVQAKLKPPPVPPRPAPAPPTPVPVPPAPAAPTQEASDVIYRVTLSDDPAQFIVGLNGPGDVQHIRTTAEAAAFTKLFPTLVLTKAAFVHYYFVPLWEEAEEGEEPQLPPTTDEDAAPGGSATP